MSKPFTDLDKQYGFPEGLLDSVWRQESARGMHMVSPAGARGHFQFMPATRQEMMEKYGLDPWSKDSQVAAKCAAIYLKQQIDRFDGDMLKGLSAYNAGGGNVNKAVRNHGGDWLSNMRPETQAYGREIMAAIGVEDRYEYNERREAGTTTSEMDEDERKKRRQILRDFGKSDKEIDAMGDGNLMGGFFLVLLMILVGDKAEAQERSSQVSVAAPAQNTVVTDPALASVLTSQQPVQVSQADAPAPLPTPVAPRQSAPQPALA